ARHVDPGEMAGPGTPLYTLLQLDQLLVRAGVTEEHINDLAPGDQVEVHVAATGTSHTGVVHAVSPVPDQGGRLYPVEFLVSNPQGKLKPGMVATVTFQGPPLPPMPVVPRTAVVTSGGEPVVYVAVRSDESWVARRRAVTLGTQVGDWVQITAGLDAGEQVITAGQTLLQDGRPIRPSEGVS
ncbi:MAG TPA: efflux RND transporter periplasmic adaptor subunit, partial [Limnochordia bacterium]